MPTPRIPTEKQIAASRANGQKSRGPKSGERRPNSAPAEIRGGILANTVVLEGESREAFHELRDSLYAELLPGSPIEIQLLESMAVARWRQMRLWALEKATIAGEVAKSGPADGLTLGAVPIDRTVVACRNLVDNSHWTEHMRRTESRYDRLYSHAMSLFHKHRAWRREEIKKLSTIPEYY